MPRDLRIACTPKHAIPVDIKYIARAVQGAKHWSRGHDDDMGDVEKRLPCMLYIKSPASNQAAAGVDAS